jgi:ferredoxin
MKGGDVDTGPESITAARKFLEGRWTLESFEVFPPGKAPITLKGSGTLNYDNFGNLTEMLKKTQRPYAHVDSKACTGCDKCAERCPFDCLHLQDVADPQSPFFSMMTVDEAKCTGCRECEKACPYDAIFIYRKDQLPDWLKTNLWAPPSAQDQAA